MADSPTSRSLKEMRARGWTAQVVERWSAHARKRVDLFGGIDVLACHPLNGILGVQACAGASHAARRAKLLDEPRLYAFVRAGGRVAVWSWTKRGAAGKRKLWTLREEDVTERIRAAGGYAGAA